MGNVKGITDQSINVEHRIIPTESAALLYDVNISLARFVGPETGKIGDYVVVFDC